MQDHFSSQTSGGTTVPATFWGSNAEITYSPDGAYMYITSANTTGSLDTENTQTIVVDTATYEIVDFGSDTTAGYYSTDPSNDGATTDNTGAMSQIIVTLSTGEQYYLGQYSDTANADSGWLAVSSVDADLVTSPEDVVQPNYIVEGTAGGDLIDSNYTGDPEGDKIDNLDHVDGSNNDSVLAGAGDDTVYAGDGNDTVYGGDGNDILDGGVGDDLLEGEGGNDSIVAGDGNDVVLGGDGSDTIIGGSGDDNLDGDNILVTGAGDYIDGGDGADTLSGDAGNDTLIGGSGGDDIFGGDGNDTIDGGTGNDFIYGDSGDDTVFGGAGDDTIGLFSGSDSVDAGDDADLIKVRNWGSYTDGDVVYVDGGTGGVDNDTLDLSEFTAFRNLTQTTDPDTDSTSGSVEVTDGSGNWITVNFAEIESLTLPPDYTVEGTAGGDLIDSNYTGDPEGDKIDNLDHFDGSNNDSVLAGAGNDTVYAGGGDDTVYGGDGNDIVGGMDGNDILYGEAGNDSVWADAGNDVLYGGTGDDEYSGADGDDTIVLEDNFGNDTIYGNEGVETTGDVLDLSNVTQDLTVDLTALDPEAGSVSNGTDTATFTGIENITLSGGRDTIVLADGSGTDTVSGFDLTDSGDGTTNDQLDVSGLTSDGGTTPVTTDDVTVTDDGSGNAVLTFPGGESITLIGVAPADVDDPAELAAIGIPPALDYIVEGSSGNDLIDGSYIGDPEGDIIDNGDGNPITPNVGDSDSIVGYGGDDTIVSDAGNDTILAGANDDSVQGGAGDDLIYGDATESVDLEAGAAIAGASNSAWTTTTINIDGVPYVVSSSWGVNGLTTISRVNPDGTLTETDRITFDNTTGTVTTTSDGDITSTLTAAGIAPGALGNGLSQSNMSYVDGDPTLFLTSQNSGSITTWQIAPDGTLDFEGGLSNFGSSQPTLRDGIVRENVHYEGSDGTDYVYVARTDVDRLDVMEYDSTTGTLTQTGITYPASDGVTSVDVISSASGDYLLASGNSDVRLYSIDPATGALTQLDVEPSTDGSNRFAEFYETSDGRVYAFYTTTNGTEAGIYEVTPSGLTLTDTITYDGGGSYASASYVDGEPVFVVPNATGGVDLYTVSSNGDLVYQTTATGIENDGTTPIIVQTSDGSYYLVDGDGNAATVPLTLAPAGDDTLIGDAGNDTVLGEGGNDVIDGGIGDDSLSGGEGSDSILAGTGNDTVDGGLGSDTISLADNFGNDIIDGGEDPDGTDVDVLDLSAVTTDTTVDLTAADPEDGTVTDGTSTATFANIENIVLGGGRDTLTLADGSGSDSVEGFDLTDSGDGTTNDQLDVSGLTSDGGTTPVTTADVTVTDDGSGNAVLTFPGGESITLIGVAPADVDEPSELVAMGIPDGRDYIVEGTDNAEWIRETYVGDPEGDRINNNDHIDGSNSDSVVAGGGADSVSTRDGDDTIEGGAGYDYILAGTGNDSIEVGADGGEAYGDGVNFNTGINASGDPADGNVVGLTINNPTDYTIRVYEISDTGVLTTVAVLSPGQSYSDPTALDNQNWLIGNEATGAYVDIIDGSNGGVAYDFGSEGFDDTFVGATSGSSYLSGQLGDDTFIESAGTNTFIGGEGDDTIVMTDNFGTGNSYDGSETFETNGDTLDMSGLTQDTTVDLTSADPEDGTITSGANDATFVNIENIILGGGRDTIVLADGSGSDSVQGFDLTDSGDGTTNDQLDVSGLTSDGGTTPVTTADVVVTDTNGDGTGDAILTFPGGESITLVGVLASQVDDPAELVALGIPSDGIVEGTAAGDLITGTYTGDPDGDMVDANDAADGSNDDVIYGYGGNDIIDAGAGNNTVFGGDGNDQIYGGSNADSIDGGTGDDSLYSGLGDDTILGGDGSDLIFASGGADSIDAGAGNDTIRFTDSDTVLGGDGDDLFRADALVLDGSPISITGGEGAETTGDTLFSGTYNGDVIVDLTAGGTGADPESGTMQLGTTTVTFSEIETVQTGIGNDSVIGSTGDDSVIAGAGADTVDGGAGNDTFDLGVDADRDVVVLGDGDGSDTVSNFDLTDSGDGTTVDQLDVSGLTSDGGTTPVTTADVVVTDTNGDGTGDAILTFPGGESITLVGVLASEVDSIDELAAIGIPDGRDYIVEGTAGSDLIDSAYTGDPEGDRIDNNDHSDGSNADSVLAGDGNDTVIAGAGNDTVLGGTGNDQLEGGDGDDSLLGEAGADVLIGGTGADTIYAGADNDTITLAEGDVVYGEGGDDLFLVTDYGEAGTNNVTIVGGETGETTGDTLDFQGLTDWANITYTNTDPGVGGGMSGFATLNDGSVVTFSEIENVIICFTAGTRIATATGLKEVQDIVPGDLVVTRDHGLQPVRWASSRTVPALGKLAPIRFSAGVLGNERDLLVSPQHRMLVQGSQPSMMFGESEVLATAKHLVNGGSIAEVPGGEVTYVHILFDWHEVIYAEGAPSESFFPGDTGLDAVDAAAREELFNVFPELRSSVGNYGETARLCLRAHESRLLTLN